MSLPTISTAPIGSNLTSLQLVDALLWTLSKASPGELSTSELDVLESKAASAVSVIRFLRNTSSPIHRLPLEALSVIFRMLHELEKPSFYLPRFPQAGTRTIELVTQVCRRWREIALALPTLWSLIYSGRDITDVSLDRCVGVPLKVYINGSPRWPFVNAAPVAEENMKLLEALKPHAMRIKELHLFEAGDEMVNSDMLSAPAPQLESLTISFSDQYYQPFQPPAAALPNLFSGIFPRLRCLTLHRFTSWASNDFKDLTHLTLSHQHTAQRLPLSQFLAFLNASPRLEDLSMVEAGPIFDGSTHPAIVLNQLRILSIGSWESAQSVSRFLSYLIIPQKLEFYVWGTSFQPTDNLATIFPLDRTQLDDVTQLRITHSPQRHLASSGNSWGGECRYAVILSPSESALQIDGHFEASQVLLTAPQSLGLSSIKELWLGCQFLTDPTDEEWRGLFSAMPLLTTLVVSRRPSQPILSSLMLQNTDSDEMMLCPDLHTLRVYADPLLSVLRLALLAEERMRKERPLRSLQVTSTISKRHSRKHNSSPLQSDLLYLQRYIQKVECNQSINSESWELLSAWPPPVFRWIPGEDRRWASDDGT